MEGVLHFYQERIASEAYLRTATERRSVLELARLIGYQLAPGVAAATAFAFTLQDAPAQRSQAAQPVTIPVGTRVQSVPDPGQDPQSFETTVAITARVEWNAIPAQQSEAVTIWTGRTELYLAGGNTQLQPGDAILIVGAENDPGLTSARWNVRWIGSVDVDLARNLTHITWPAPLSATWSADASYGLRVYALRQRAALFGHNAPKPHLIFNSNNPHSNQLTIAGRSLTYPMFGTSVILDRLEPGLAPGQLIAVSGKRQRVVVGLDTTSVSFPDDLKRTPLVGESFVMLAAPEQLLSGGTQALTPDQLDPEASPPLAGTLRWHLQDGDGTAVTIEAPAGSLQLQPAPQDDAAVSEVCSIANEPDAVRGDADRTAVAPQTPRTSCHGPAT